MKTQFESLSLDKFKKEELKNLSKIVGGNDPNYETGCADAPDCCTGSDCADDEPMDQ
ncbi:hypothetical protein QQY79_02690 [Flavobacterium tructae]|uniref:hypothetical protein n=1 Tax=Flavobacterium tructae TaxID=1114873 RepID=UPI002551F29C|nr:hypothetical protein [Flavobacterium tructae]MDL2141414.1 hypothetical protein [Flavobacterium tructae]